MTTLTGQQIAGEGLTGWAYLLGGLHTRVRTGDFATGVALLAAIGAAAEEANHHPDVNLRRDHVDLRLTSDGERGVTERDVRLARAITSLAGDAGLAPESATVSRLELALDTPDHAAVLPFWAAVLAMTPGDGEVRDPADTMPVVWFQESGSEEPRQRWHPDVWVEPAQVRPRIDAALAAGGTLVSDAAAPSYWVLADPEGNRVCLCTWQQRA
ncbi:VOC family protein [Actinophytocola glycyrrhizae]|uniref:Putative pterin-4-alpha-carbinolamine dehydratase n=1 Tax=Actinophytocola glycyrrhizae TaxID=2044873 RepID=A0ABV9S9H1_9PSEU